MQVLNHRPAKRCVAMGGNVDKLDKRNLLGVVFRKPILATVDDKVNRRL
jgi:hypothetical protein